MIKSKKIHFILFLVFTASCSNINNNGNTDGYGYIEINLPVINSRNIDVGFAMANTDTYSVIIYNDTTTINSDISNVSENDQISVPVGTYSIVVLAGNSYYSDSVCLLGSGNESGVIVVEDQVTPVSIELSSINFQLTVPTEVIAGEQFQIDLSFDTNSPVISCEPYGSGRGGDVRLDDNNNNIIYGTYDGIYDTNRFSGSVILTAPGTVTSDTIHYYSPYVYLNDSSVGVTLGIFEIGRNWTLPNCQNTDMSSETLIPINFVEATTGVSVTVTWGPS